MKVGDMVRREIPQMLDESGQPLVDHGVVIRLSRTGHHTLSAEVRWTDGNTSWTDGGELVVISETRR